MSRTCSYDPGRQSAKRLVDFGVNLSRWIFYSIGSPFGIDRPWGVTRVHDFDATSRTARAPLAELMFVVGEGQPAIIQLYRWRDARRVKRYGSKFAARKGASGRLVRSFDQ